MTNWTDLGKKLQEQFKIKTFPIGYKRFESPDDIDGITGLQRPEHRFTICMLISQARRWGHTVGTKRTDKMVFTHCAMIHGLMEVRPELLQVPSPGTEMPEGVGRYVADWDDNARRNRALPRIPVGGAVAFAPLQTISFEPDVVLIYADPAQVILMIQAMQKVEFERYQSGCIGESSCADSLAECYLTGKPKIGLPGYGERALGHVADEEIVLALPPGYVIRVLDGFAALRQTGVTYPVALAGLDFDLAGTPSIYERPIEPL